MTKTMTEQNVPDRSAVALLTIDLQRDFACQGSPIQASGLGACMPRIRRIVQAFREYEKPIFHAVRLYRPDGSNVDLCRRSAVMEGLRVLMPGTKGAELLDDIKPKEDIRLDSEELLSGGFQELGANEWAYYKPRWGAFYGTELEKRLRESGIGTLVVVGCNFPTGGRATIYEGCARDFCVIAGSDAICDASRDGLDELGRLGAYQKTTDAVLEWLSGKRQNSAA